MPAHKDVLVNVREERTIIVPVGSTMNALREGATHDDDWVLKEITPIMGGNQRDPVADGVWLTYARAR